MRVNNSSSGKRVSSKDATVALIVPCYNEAATIGQVIRDAKRVLPAATVYVCDNNSNDGTSAVAAKHGAVVLTESRQGKGFAVQRLFNAIEADIYVLVDGDSTYDLGALPGLIETLRRDRLGMVVGGRMAKEAEAYRLGHRWGNWAITGMLGLLFEPRFADILSGYRVLSRAFVKSFPMNAGGFTIESALTVHALRLRIPSVEVPTTYSARPKGSFSKLNTWRDGFRISLFIVGLFASERPLVFYAVCGGVLLLAAAILFAPVLVTYLVTGLVPRLPTLVVAGALGVCALLSLLVGVVVQSVANARREAKQLAYLGA